MLRSMGMNFWLTQAQGLRIGGQQSIHHEQAPRAVLCRQLLERSAFGSSTLCHGDGASGRGLGHRRTFILLTYPLKCDAQAIPAFGRTD